MTEQHKQRPTSPHTGPVHRVGIQGSGSAPVVRRPVQGQGARPMQPGARRPVQGQGARPMQPGVRRPVQGQGVRHPQPGMRRPVQGQGARPMQPEARGQQPVQKTRVETVQQQGVGGLLSQPWFVGVIAFLCGILIGAMVFTGSSKPQQQVGLSGVVKNTDIRSRTPRCGQIDKGQACVLYIMNNTRYDKIAENFFETALRLTEVPLFSISMANPKYAKRRIPPGAFAEILIPKVR